MKVLIHKMQGEGVEEAEVVAVYPRSDAVEVKVGQKYRMHLGYIFKCSKRNKKFFKQIITLADKEEAICNKRCTLYDKREEWTIKELAKEFNQIF